MTEQQAQAISQKLANCMNEGIMDGFEKVLNSLKAEPAIKGCICISQAILMAYTSYKADMLARFLEKAIRINPEWPKVKGKGINPLFQVGFLTGSWDLYQCFIEEVDGITDEMLADAYGEWYNMNEQILDSYHMFLKGREYNSGVTMDGKQVIDIEDFKIMNLMSENYNAILGRRKILKDLDDRLK
jgi:hypothetical protein